MVSNQKQVEINPQSNTAPLRVYLGLFIVPFLWGQTFILTKGLVRDYPVYSVTGLRHLIALLGFLPYAKKIKKLERNMLFGGFLTGACNFFAIVLQTFGLKSTTSGKAGFITSLYIILIPVFLWMFFGRKIQKKVVVAVVISGIGLAILMLDPNSAIQSREESMIATGDLLIAGSAVLFAFQLIFTEKYVKLKAAEKKEGKTENEESEPQNKNNKSSIKKKRRNKATDPILFVILQLFIITVLGGVFSVFFGEQLALNNITPKNWAKFLYLGIFGTTFPFLFHNWGQKFISSDKTGIIFATEPIWATAFGIWIDKEEFSWRIGVGGILILISIYIVLYKPKKKRSVKKS